MKLELAPSDEDRLLFSDFKLFAFAREVLGYALLEEDPHFQWCNELDQHH